MCGIVGLFYKNGLIAPELLESATSVLTHRGPDGRNHWLSKDRTVGLGHTRLSVIDLEGGAQPLHSEDGSIHAVVNGEIYDFERIRGELKERGHRFKTASDSELLIHLYEEKGLDAVRSMRGEFAFILWDTKLNKLFAGRDRFGIKPLFYTMQNGNLYFASEIKALLAMGVPAYWDEESLYISFFMGAIPLQDRTFFKDVFQVPPGCTVTMENNNLRIRKYWDFNYPVLKEQDKKKYVEEEVAEQFRGLFEDAVRLRLRADVPVGVYLSGGIDSCSILGTVTKIKGDKAKAFTIRFANTAYDESAAAREMAELSNADLSVCTVTPDLLAANFKDSIYHSESLVTNSHGVAKFILSRHVKESGYKAILTGEGSDEILGGYVHFRQDMLLHDSEHKQNFNLKKAFFELREKNKIYGNRFHTARDIQNHSNIVKERLGFTPSWLFTYMAAARKSKLLVSKKTGLKYAHIDPYAVFLDGIEAEKELRGRHPLHQSLYLWSKLVLPNYLLSNMGDRVEMGHGVEGRLPFLDHKLVEFVASLPANFKIRNMREKYLLREALRPMLPKTIYKRQKHPFMAPPSAGNKDPMFRFMCAYIGDNVNKLPHFDPLKIRGLLKILPFLPEKPRRSLDSLLVTLSSMVALQEQFKIRKYEK